MTVYEDDQCTVYRDDVYMLTGGLLCHMTPPQHFFMFTDFDDLSVTLKSVPLTSGESVTTARLLSPPRSQVMSQMCAQ